jgi:hypothetical protein
VQTSDVIAARVVVVDAIDDGAAEFYRRWGFIDAPGNPHRLTRKVSASDARWIKARTSERRIDRDGATSQKKSLIRNATTLSIVLSTRSRVMRRFLA